MRLNKLLSTLLVLWFLKYIWFKVVYTEHWCNVAIAFNGTTMLNVDATYPILFTAGIGLVILWPMWRRK